MKYFTDKNNQVRAFEDDDAPHHYEGMSPITESQALELVAGSKPTTAELLEQAKAELRTMRAPMLDALTGIAGRAARSGNDALAAEADLLAEQLLDITDDPVLNSAQTYEEMRLAGHDAFRRIAASASDAFSATFREFK